LLARYWPDKRSTSASLVMPSSRPLARP
jgi:hypothetical protein